MQVAIRLEIGFDPHRTGSPEKWRTLGGTINMPALPRVGEALCFEGDTPNSAVEKIEWCPSPGKRNVFLPYLWLERRIVEKTEAHFVLELSQVVAADEVKLTFID